MIPDKTTLAIELGQTIYHNTIESLTQQRDELAAYNDELLAVFCIVNGDPYFDQLDAETQYATEQILEKQSPSKDILRNRDVALLCKVLEKIQPQDSYQDDYFKAKVHSYNVVKEMIKELEKGE